VQSKVGREAGIIGTKVLEIEHVLEAETIDQMMGQRL
jgi:hypothetical protein